MHMLPLNIHSQPLEHQIKRGQLFFSAAERFNLPFMVPDQAKVYPHIDRLCY